MKLIVLYLCAILASLLTLFILFVQNLLPVWLNTYKLYFYCLLVGGAGGCVYCLRGVYLNACVKKNWDSTWIPWYYIRPVVSCVCGTVSALFLKAGLLVLGASHHEVSSEIGFYALAFISGYNVDKFLSKIEDIAQASWGIEKSRSADNNKAPKENQSDAAPK